MVSKRNKRRMILFFIAFFLFQRHVNNNNSIHTHTIHSKIYIYNNSVISSRNFCSNLTIIKRSSNIQKRISNNIKNIFSSNKSITSNNSGCGHNSFIKLDKYINGIVYFVKKKVKLIYKYNF